MKLKNKETGEVEFMRYDPAVSAVQAGTHEYVSDEGEPNPGTQADLDQGDDATEVIAPAAVRSAPEGDQAADADLDAMTKDELRAEAERRGVKVKSGATKAEHLDALKA